MGNVNKVFLMGNLTRDPELRHIPSGTAVCALGLATNRRFKTREGEQKDETCFVDIDFWGRRGEIISEYFKKGDPIFIEGRLKLDQWETADGKRSKMKVVGEDFQFVGGSRGEGSGGGGSAGAQSTRESAGAGPSGPQSEPEDEGYDVSDDEIPF